ncbi:relaxase/mobilization nuclease domain-containing protein [Pacificibacter sp. AS14]|uniref:relaxase/mobilization nuclease domain-containing protein n=1 Tax=Pacificibacter sp. AS14 TaxID=3135785 RepID=UPI00316E57E2
MILVGNQRGGGKNLALHLMKDENEHVQVHQIRGFASDDLQFAFQESYAMSRATRCKQHLFSLSLNPPHEANTSPELFEETADKVEVRLGLVGQPRAIVLHTKNGRTHAHAVWCRVDTENMKAVQLSFTKRKMQDLSRELYREHGWVMPRGFERTEFRDPRNYSLAEWQQAKRADKDPAKLKAMFQDTWAMSDSKPAFEHALQERGFHLARGDRRGHVAVDYKGEVYPISRWTGVKAKDVRARLGDLNVLPSVAQAERAAKDVVAKRLAELERQQTEQERIKASQLARQKEQQARAHHEHLAKVAAEQKAKRAHAQAERNARLRKGLAGLLDRITGKRRKIVAKNEFEAKQAVVRDQVQLKQVAQVQTHSNLEVLSKEQTLRRQFKESRSELRQDIQNLKKPTEEEPSKDAKRDAYMRKRKRQSTSPRPKRSRDGPDLSR